MKIFRVFLILILFNSYCICAKAQIKTIEFHQLDSITTLQSRPTIIFIHTDWCKYCAAMKQSTFKNKSVVEAINKDYYFIDFNAETRNQIVFNNRTFAYEPTGTNTGIHELAKFFVESNAEISYPMITILDTSKKILFQQSGYISSKQMSFILQQFLQ